MNVRDNSLSPPTEANSTDPEATATRVEGLLAAVVAACECMVQQADLLVGMQAAVTQLGRLSGHDRAYVFELTDEQTVCVCIAEWSAPGIGRVSDMAGTARFDVADFMEVWAPLLAGQAYQSTTPLKTGANAALNQAVANRSDVMVPIFVGDRCWGCIGFDNCTEERRYGPAEIQALRGAAAAVAAAVQRSDTEARRLAQQRHTAEEALALNCLLEGVVRASRALLDTTDFDQGLQRWLAFLAQAVDADAAGMGSFESEPPAGALTSLKHYWSRGGAPNEGNPVPATKDFSEWAARLKQGDSIWAHRDELQDPASVHFWVATDCYTNLLMPVVSDGRTVGWLGFDWRERQAWRPAFAAALGTAADGLAAALQRQQAIQHALDEREQRIAAEQARADEATLHTARVERHSRLLAAVAESAEELLACAHPADCMDAVLARVGEVTHAERVCLARVGLTPLDPAQHGWQEITHEWTRPGVARQMDGQLRRMAMRRGDASWDFAVNQISTQGRLLIDIDSLDEPVRSEQRALGVAWTLCYPVLLEGKVSGLMGIDYATPFDDYDEADLAALQTVATTIADAMCRQELEARALAAERARADEAERHAARVERHARLLEAVARSTEILLAAPTPSQGIDRVLETLCVATGSDRVCYAHFEFTPADADLHGWRHITHEWNRPGTVRKLDTGLRSVPMRRTDASWENKLARLRTPGWFRRRVEDHDDPDDSALRKMGVVWILRFAVLAGDRVVALLGFDYSDPFESFEEATIDALQTVASAIADALLRQALETRALAAERARADESARLAALLAQVVSSSRTLIDAELQAFEPALLAWLGGFGSAVGAIRCTFYDLVDFESTGRRTARMLAEWVHDGVDGSMPVSFAAPITIDPRGAEPLMDKLTAGHAVAFHTEDTEGPMRDFLAQQGNATVVAVPLVMDGQPWGCLSFDHAERRDPQPGEFAVLQTAADTLATILKRNEALRHMLAEREARLTAEQQRSTELARANRSLRQSLDALAGVGGETAFLSQSLVQLQRELGAQAAYLFRNDGSGSRLRLVGRAAQGRFSAEAAADDPAMFTQGFEMVPALLARLRQHGRLLWRRVDPATPVDADTPESTRWHLRMGHRANIVHALMVGERQVGFIGLVFDDDLPPAESKLDLAHALCQPITLALELARLSRLAQRSSEQNAVLAERSRLAREIHDGIAQSFLAIQMQLDTLEPGVQARQPVLQALDMARYGLTEARRAVAALRPQGLLNHDLPKGVQRLLAPMAAQGALQCALDSPAAWQGLPPEVEDNLFRIVQEAANNVLKHARAHHLRVEISQAAGEATVLIADDGVGFDPVHLPAGHGFGLESMKQRAQLIGARIDWLSKPGKGTQVLVSWSEPAALAQPGTAPRTAS